MTEAETTGTTTSPMIGELCDSPAPPSGDPASPDLAPECACVDPLDGWVTCESAICPELRGTCHHLDDFSFGCEGNLSWTYDEAALTCALEAARDGKEGTIRWYFGDGFWQLRDANYFAGCLALASPCERMHCLFAGTTGPALSRCAPGYMYNP